MSHSHRPTQKQTNKAFKSKHSTKGARRDEAKGRTHRPAVKTALTRGSSNASTSFTRLNRRNQATQRKLKKRGELEELGQLFSRKGEEKVARVVAVVPMTGDVVASQVVEQLLAAVGVVGTGEHGMRTAELVVPLRLLGLQADPGCPAGSHASTRRRSRSCCYRLRHLQLLCSQFWTHVRPPTLWSLPCPPSRRSMRRARLLSGAWVAWVLEASEASLES